MDIRDGTCMNNDMWNYSGKILSKSCNSILQAVVDGFFTDFL